MFFSVLCAVRSGVHIVNETDSRIIRRLNSWVITATLD